MRKQQSVAASLCRSASLHGCARGVTAAMHVPHGDRSAIRGLLLLLRVHSGRRGRRGFSSAPGLGRPTGSPDSSPGCALCLRHPCLRLDVDDSSRPPRALGREHGAVRVQRVLGAGVDERRVGRADRRDETLHEEEIGAAVAVQPPDRRAAGRGLLQRVADGARAGEEIEVADSVPVAVDLPRAPNTRVFLVHVSSVKAAMVNAAVCPPRNWRLTV